MTVAALLGVPESSWKSIKPCGNDSQDGGARGGDLTCPVRGMNPAVLAVLTCQLWVEAALAVDVDCCGAVQLAFPVGLTQDQPQLPALEVTLLAVPALHRLRVGTKAAVTLPAVPQAPDAIGVAALLAAEAAPVPTALVAVTVKVYAVPLVSPVTVMGLVEPEPVRLPGLEVTV